ncbi:hypothetical protein LJC00_01390 [Dysgonomonas sp. OttesenSCG-928-M03]|nr:hypothetical protein [Dysgonomonas sp. OttesenSCG-928-M03]
MRRLLFALVLPVLFLTSCYNVRVAVGDVSPDQPLVKVAKQRNHFFIDGLVPGGNNKLRAEDYIGNRDRYVVRTHTSFVNGLLNAITFGVYNPTTTTFYVPADDYNYEDEFASKNQRKERKNRSKQRRNRDQESIRYDSPAEFEEYPQDEYREEPAQVTSRRDFNRRDSREPQDVENFDYLERRETEQPFIQKNEPIVEEQAIPEPPTRVESYQQVGKRDYNRRVQSAQPSPVKNETRNYNNKSINDNSQVVLSPTRTTSNNFASSGEYKGVVYFKNGAKMNGTITEHSSGDVTIKLPGGTTMESKKKDIEKIERK